MNPTKLRGSSQIRWDDNIDFNAKILRNLGTPTLDSDAATKAYVDGILDSLNGFQNKGGIDCSSNPNYPAASNGHVYIVTVGGKIGGGSGDSVAAGDLLLCKVDASASGTTAAVGANWDLIHVAGASGTVTSTSGSAVDNSIVRMDATSGAVIQTSLAQIDDSGSVNIPTGQSYKINGSALTQDNIPDGTTNKAFTATEKTKLSGIATSADVTSATNVGTSVNGSSAKGTLVDGDKFAIIDSEASNVLKTSLWSVIKSTLKTYFMGLYVCREVPTGTMNGSNTVFTLANTPVSGTEMVFVDGILMNAGALNDYTISTNSITFAVAPVSTDVILVTYWK